MLEAHLIKGKIIGQTMSPELFRAYIKFARKKGYFMKCNFLCFLILGFIASPALSADESFRFGAQTSLNSYRVVDPAGTTAGGNGLSVSGIVLYDIGRNDRLMLNINKDAYKLAASTTDIGQDVSSFGGGLSYQSMLRITRTFKPWIGAGFGYSSATYKNRYKLTPGGFSVPMANRDATDVALLLNANSEWQFNHNWDIGLQAQVAKSIRDKSSAFRVGVYVVY